MKKAAKGKLSQSFGLIFLTMLTIEPTFNSEALFWRTVPIDRNTPGDTTDLMGKQTLITTLFPRIVRKGTIHKSYCNVGQATWWPQYAWLAKMTTMSSYNLLWHLPKYDPPSWSLYSSFPKDISYFLFLETAGNPTQRHTPRNPLVPETVLLTSSNG